MNQRTNIDWCPDLIRFMANMAIRLFLYSSTEAEVFPLMRQTDSEQYN